jgi:hypothetical protein
MSQQLTKDEISGLMAWWGRKGGLRATEAQKNAARENLKKTPQMGMSLTQVGPRSSMRRWWKSIRAV